MTEPALYERLHDFCETNGLLFWETLSECKRRWLKKNSAWASLELQRQLKESSSIHHRKKVICRIWLNTNFESSCHTTRGRAELEAIKNFLDSQGAGDDSV